MILKFFEAYLKGVIGKKLNMKVSWFLWTLRNYGHKSPKLIRVRKNYESF